MKTVKFTVLGEPTGKGRPQTKVMYSEKGFKNKKTGKVRNTLVNNVTPKKTVIYENEVKELHPLPTQFDFVVLRKFVNPKRTQES